MDKQDFIANCHQQLVEIFEKAKAHFQVFGESIETRKSRKVSLKEAVARGDDDFINIPAYERNSS